MSIFSDARATIFIADHAVAGTDGKINALGVGFRVSGIGANGLTPPQAVVVLIDLPDKYVGQEFPVSLDLRNAQTNEIVKMVGPTGNADSLRIQQLVKAEPLMIPGVYLPSGLGSRVQVVLNFPTGLQLQPGVTYRWGLEIEGQSRPGWIAEFHVAGPPPGPVIGGPADPPAEQLPSWTEYEVPRPGAKPEEGQEADEGETP